MTYKKIAKQPSDLSLVCHHNVIPPLVGLVTAVLGSCRPLRLLPVVSRGFDGGCRLRPARASVHHGLPQKGHGQVSYSEAIKLRSWSCTARGRAMRKMVYVNRDIVRTLKSHFAG